MHSRAHNWAQNLRAGRSRSGYRRYLHLSALLSLAVLAGGLLAKQIAAAGFHVHHCMDVGQVSSWLGMRLQLLQASPNCPSGAAAATGESAINVVFSISLPLLVFTALGAGTSFALTSKLLWLLNRASRWMMPRQRTPRIITAMRPQLRAAGQTFSVLHAQLVANLRWRGPPVRALA